MVQGKLHLSVKMSDIKCPNVKDSVAGGDIGVLRKQSGT